MKGNERRRRNEGGQPPSTNFYRITFTDEDARPKERKKEMQPN
jgi:hypothetical protein